MESKVCSICGREKPLSEFALKRPEKMVMLLIVSLVERSIGMNIIDFIKSIIKKKQQPIKERRLKN